MNTDEQGTTKIKVANFWAWKLASGKWLGFDPKHPETTNVFGTPHYATKDAAQPFKSVVSNIVESGKALNMNFTEREVKHFLNLKPGKLVFVRIYAEYRE